MTFVLAYLATLFGLNLLTATVYMNQTKYGLATLSVLFAALDFTSFFLLWDLR